MSETELVLAAIQVRLAVHDLESPTRFRALVDGLGERAAEAGGEHRVWVFPENIGLLLPLAFASSGDVLGRDSLDRAFAALALRRPLAVARGLLESGGLGLHRGVLRAYLPRTDRLMRECFAALARRHRAWVVAGSHLRADVGGRLTASSYTFEPGGRLAAVTDKVNLVPGVDDAAPGGLGLGRGDVDRLPVVRAPWGALATVIGYDAAAAPRSEAERFCRVAARADEAGADVLANPAATPAPWSEQEVAEGLAASLARPGHAAYGVIARLCGAVLDRSWEGRSQILARRGGGVRVLATAEGHTDSEVVTAAVPAPARLTAGGREVTG